MAGHRSERMGERIHQEISLMLDREISDPRLAGVTVTRVEVTGDLRLAKVYVSPRSDAAENHEMMEGLARAGHYMRKQLAANMDSRYTPELRFHIDRSIEAGERFLKVLEQVHAEERAAARPKRGRPSSKGK
jgi:ribosome-binding factor A